jgi:hypothetical protein
VSEHFLDGTEVCTAFYEVRGKRMAESVRAYVFVDFRLFAEFFYDCENHHAGQLTAATVEEKEVFVGIVDGKVAAHLFYIKTDVFQRRF